MVGRRGRVARQTSFEIGSELAVVGSQVMGHFGPPYISFAREQLPFPFMTILAH